MNDYRSHEIEAKVRKIWKQQNVTFSNLTSKKICSILMPPPNVTGKLHLGHALNNFLQDTIIRFHRLKGYQTIWIPGLDHAGIATEVIVKNWIKNNNFVLNKEKDLHWYLKKWVALRQKDIQEQWDKLGLLINKEHLNFTLNEDVQKKVQKVFYQLYHQKLIYRAQKLVNWDIQQKTAISNLEVEYRAQKGKLYYIKYFHENQKDYLVVATTRPETIFVDQALLFNPQDLKYQKWENNKFINPLTNNLIPLLTSKKVEKNFGSGILKCTPGHDFKDWEIGKEKNLKPLSCFHENGTLNEYGEKFQNLDRFQARNKIIAFLKTKNLLLKEQEITHNLPYSKRTETIIEPFLSSQWFLKTKVWAQKMLTLKKDINFIPNKFQNTFLKWMQKCDDWCISRQLTWGHRLPVYFDDNGNVKVSLKKIDSKKWKQSQDVLDTWFSSGLWSLINFSWKENREVIFKNLQQISYVVTSYDIIFFWIARMLFLHHHFQKKIPFQNILIHGLIRTKNRQKMSKSKGNVIDPLELISKYGVDALRFYLLSNHKIGEDLSFKEEKLINGYHLMHKIWNIQKFILQTKQKFPLLEDAKFANLYEVLKQNNQLSKMTFYNFINYLKEEEAKILTAFQNKKWDVNIKAIVVLIKFFSNKMIKKFQTISENKLQNYQILLYGWLKIIRLLHPFVPFLTEYFWNELHQEKYSILESSSPQKKPKLKIYHGGILKS